MLPVVDAWFEFERISDDVTRIWEPHVSRVLQCNIWHIRGRDADLLVDSGMGVASLHAAAKRLFNHDVLAVATHSHVDHVGSLHEFSNRIAHRVENEVLSRRSGNFSMLREDHPPEMTAMLERAGYEVPACHLCAVPHADFDLRRFTTEPAPPTRLVDEGDVIDLGDRRFEVLHLPGHSPGSIGLWEAASETLFSGDAIYDGPLLDGGSDSDINAYIATMRRLEALPARIVHAGHDPSFDGAKLRELARRYLDRQGA